jgi:hypothetical protein
MGAASGERGGHTPTIILNHPVLNTKTDFVREEEEFMACSISESVVNIGLS